MSRIDEVRQWSVKALDGYNFWNPSMGSLEDIVEGRILASSPHADNHLLRTKHLDYEMLQLLYLADVDELWAYPTGRQLNQKPLHARADVFHGAARDGVSMERRAHQEPAGGG